MLGKAIQILTSEKIKCEYEVVYFIKDSEVVKNRLIEKALEKSRNKAEMIANVSGVKLGQIVLIDYTWKDEVISSKRYKLTLGTGSSTGTDSEFTVIDNVGVEDLLVEEEIYVEWSIL